MPLFTFYSVSMGTFLRAKADLEMYKMYYSNMNFTSLSQTMKTTAVAIKKNEIAWFWNRTKVPRCPIIRAPYVLQINICLQCSTIWNSVAAMMQSYAKKLFEEMYTNKDGWHFSQNVLTLISIYYHKWHMHTTSFFHRFQHRISFFSSTRENISWIYQQF